MRKYVELVAFGVVLLGILALEVYPHRQTQEAGARMSTSIVSDKRYSMDMKELQTRFNEDKGKVRLLMLLSPS